MSSRSPAGVSRQAVRRPCRSPASQPSPGAAGERLPDGLLLHAEQPERPQERRRPDRPAAGEHELAQHRQQQ
ncbi:hypothetical protein [Actinomadura madurae]|uniref:hypothetical protein n=1 Tax=Actinomadura madurae TaxID=1993 RepID=UPI0020D261D1|nr:hypothetical protein [Actinomadura madurae]MCP9965229.1 hypothetical protein [Actinomadura madurae]MCQ0010790.1 hypothetical protein [Actinomadura madurae]